MTPTLPPTSNPTNGIGPSTAQLDMETSIISPLISQHVSVMTQQNLDSLNDGYIEKTFVLCIINTSSHPVLVKTHKFVKQVSTLSMLKV